jgi:hypothetical protein
VGVVIAISFLVGLGWLGAAISWLDAQGGFTQGILVAAAAGLYGLVQALTERGWKRIQAKNTERREDERQRKLADEEKKRLFDSSPAELGILDHGENMTKSLGEVLELTKLSVEPIGHIISVLVAKAKDLPVNTELKRRVVAEIADALRDDVLELERIATEVCPITDTWIDAYRAFFADEHVRRTLPDEQKAALLLTNQTSVAQTLQTLSKLMMFRRRDVLLFRGKQQALNRIVFRSATAIEQTAGAIDEITEFCLAELPGLLQSSRRD